MAEEEVLKISNQSTPKKELPADRLVIWLNFWRFIITTLVVGVVTTVINWQIQLYELKLERQKREQDYIAQFLAQAMDENLDKRLRFAQYFSKLTLSPDMNNLWNAYYNDLQAQEFETIGRIRFLQSRLDQLRRKGSLSLLEEEQVTLLTSQIELLQKEIPRDVSSFKTWIPANLDLPIDKGVSFTWRDVTKGGSRIPETPEHVQNIIDLAKELEKAKVQLESQLGKPVIIVSWYRPAAVNALVGGASESSHIDGTGVDIQVEGYTGKELAQSLEWWPGGMGLYSGRLPILHLDIRQKRRWGF